MQPTPNLIGKNRESTGRPRKYWLAVKRRQLEAAKSFDTLCNIRDNQVLERKKVMDPATGQFQEITVVANVKVLVEACKEILDRTLGKARQEIEVSGEGLKTTSMIMVLNRPDGDTATEGQMVELFRQRAARRALPGATEAEIIAATENSVSPAKTPEKPKDSNT